MATHTWTITWGDNKPDISVATGGTVVSGDAQIIVDDSSIVDQNDLARLLEKAAELVRESDWPPA